LHIYCQNYFDTKISKSLYCVAVFDVHYNKADFFNSYTHIFSLTHKHTHFFSTSLSFKYISTYSYTHTISLSLRHTHTHTFAPHLSLPQIHKHILIQSLSLLNTHTLKSLSLAFVVDKCILKGLPRILSIAANKDKQFCFDENNDFVKLAYTIV